MNTLVVAAVALFLMFPQTAVVSGRVLDREGKPMAQARVVYTETSNGRAYKFNTDRNGEFSFPGVVFGNYKVEITAPDGAQVFTGTMSVGIEPGTGGRPLKSNVLNVDLSTLGANPVDPASHTERTHFYACESLRNNGNLEAAIRECDQAIAADPAQWEPYQSKAIAQSALGRSEAAITTYDAGILAAKAAAASHLRPEKAQNGMGQMLNAEGNIYAQSLQYDKASSLFTQAAEVSVYPALPYFNLCALFYNRSDRQAAVSACDKAIASDPTMADAYFIKAVVLFGQGKLEQGKYHVPDGTAEALNKYLELSPEGQHAADVRAMLEKVDSTIETIYKPKGK